MSASDNPGPKPSKQPASRLRVDLVAQVAGAIAATYKKDGRSMTADEVASECVELAMRVIRRAEQAVAAEAAP